MAQRDNEEEYEYEETIVMVELQGIMENDFLSQVSQAKILGIDTEKPLLQLDDYTFTGQYSDTMGTDLIFEDKTDSSGSDAKPEEKKLEYSCLTNKKLCLQRMFLKNNNDITPLDTAADEMENEDHETSRESDKEEPDCIKPGPSSDFTTSKVSDTGVEQNRSMDSTKNEQAETIQENT